ncbi:MAG: hypothetical protein JWR43_2730 [Phenylobacterium sp.]|jgi:hypothetical protein|nr:hypothetical protein [Phenylobacterium sp.]
MQTSTLLAVLLSAAALAPAAMAQGPKPASPAAARKAPRTAFGQPDLQGLWTNATITPLERPTKYGERLVLTPQEAAAAEGDRDKEVANGLKPSTDLDKKEIATCEVKGFSGVDCGYNAFWVDPGTKVMRVGTEARTSLITSTPEGKIPPLTAAGQARVAQRAKLRATGKAFDGPEFLSLGERCILSFSSSAGPPMLPLLYNNNYQIVQTPDAVVIEVEMVHDTRVIRLNGKHGPAGVRQWMGDSIGHWEGDTLVVETVNLRPEQAFRGASGDVKVIERFTRMGPRQIKYDFTIEDPASFTRPWGGELAMTATKGPLYEYACHEGNHAMEGILAGARLQEKQGKAVGPAAEEEGGQ